MTKSTKRDADLRQMLNDRRKKFQAEVQSRIRDGRSDRASDVRDDVEVSDADVQGELEMALLQLSAETVLRIDQALVRLDAGEYGRCFECAGEIADGRLRAQPFAVRCLSCEERREKQGRVRELAQRRGGFSLFPDTIGH